MAPRGFRLQTHQINLVTAQETNGSNAEAAIPPVASRLTNEPLPESGTLPR
jgi:hypothetical protein